jgi:hypothetical protein
MKATPEKGWIPLEEAIPRDVFLSEVMVWAERIGVEPKRITIRKMTNKWGSCSTNGELTFDSRLLHQSAEFRRRVIVEELVHLRVPNHSTLFKSMLRAYLAQV